MACIEDQLRFEEEMRDLGQANALKALQKAIEGHRGDDTPLGGALVRQYILSFSKRLTEELTTNLDGVRKYKSFAPLLMDIDTDSAALVTLATTVAHLLDTPPEKICTLPALAGAVGRSLYGELILSNFHDINPELYEALTLDHKRRMSKDLRHKLTVFKMQAAKNGIELPDWTPPQKVHVGLYLLNLLAEPLGDLPPLIYIRLQGSGKKSAYCVDFEDHAQSVINSVSDGLLARVGQAAPCLIPPQDWTGESGVGGYYGALKVRAPRFFKGHSLAWEIMQERGCDPTVLLQMLNAHQRVAWKVNPYTLNLVKEMRRRGYVIPGKIEHTGQHSQLKPERPPWLDKMDAKELPPDKQAIFQEWKRKTRDWHTEMKRLGRIESKLNTLVKVASSMSHHPKFYYVFQADSRGRMYPVSGVLNPQGSDVQKALLHAAEGEHIEGDKALWWFKLSMAGKYGVDKLAPDECVQWVDDHEWEIVNAALDPLNRDAFAWWSDADKPLQFIALCDEYRRYLEDPKGFICRIAVAMDGTCNGLQNYSALLRDEVGGLATNLISTPDKVPADIYADVAKAAYRRLVQMPDSPYKRGWMEEMFNRKVTKRSTMTLVYGSTFGTCRDSVIEYIKDNGLFEGMEYEFGDYAAKLIWEGIRDVVVKAVECMGWLRKCASKLFKSGVKHLSWVAPTGFRVVQLYDRLPEYRISAYIGKSARIRVKLKDFDGTTGPDKRKNADAFPPNFIHSIDASHMAFVSVAMSVLNYGGFMHFIHDDFGVLPNHAEDLARVIREEFIRMHNHFKLSELLAEYEVKLPEPPASGNLDLESVRSSINFFR